MISNFTAVSYSVLKSMQSALGLQIYYIPLDSGYTLVAPAQEFALTTLAVGADATDFSANLLASSTLVGSESEAIALSRTALPTIESLSGNQVGTQFDSKMQAVGGQGIGGFVPSAARGPVTVDRNQLAVVNLDGEGNICTRGNSFSDEGSYRDDFPGMSLSMNVTGTVTIVANNGTVIGSGTQFLSEIDRDCYIKVTTDNETFWSLVGRVVSDTELHLDAGLYSGTVGTGLSLNHTKWPTVTGSGSAGITVGSGLVTIPSGTTSGAITRIDRQGDYLPLVFECRAKMTQRIVNNEGFIGFSDNPASPGSQAIIVFDGTDPTKVKLRSSCNTSNSEIEESTFILPPGLNTTLMINYAIGVGGSGVTLSVNRMPLGGNYTHIPGPYDVMDAVAGVNNTGTPASSTSLIADFVMLRNFDTAAIEQPNISQPIPVTAATDLSVVIKQERKSVGHYIPVPFTIPVPAGKVRYLDWIVPAFTNGMDWMGLIFNASDVTSGDSIVMGKGLMGTIAQVAVPASIGDTTIYIASVPGVLTTTARGGAIDEGFYLTFGTDTSQAGPTDGSVSGSINGEADGGSHGSDSNPNQELTEYQILRFTDQDTSGVSQITLASPLTANISATTPVNLVVRVIEQVMPVTKGHTYNFGGNALRSGNLPGGSTVRVGFRNSSGSDETVRAYLETMR